MLLPYATNHPIRRFPIATVTIIAINILVFLAGVFAEGTRAFLGGSETIVKEFGYVPAHPSFFNALFSMFIHGGFMHLLGNIWYLWVFGIVVEDGLGPAIYVAFYFLTGFAATGLHHWFAASFARGDMLVPCIGASGAIAGILGICAVRYYRTKVRIWYYYWLLLVPKVGVFSLASWIFLSLWLLPQLFNGIFAALTGAASGVAYWAHIGGFLLGVWMSLFMGFEKQAKSDAVLDDLSERMTDGSAFGAEADLRDILKRDPQNAEAYYRLARLLRSDQRRSGEAADNYLRAIEVYMRADNNAAGLDIYREAAEVFTDYPLSDGKLYLIAAAMEEEKRFMDSLSLLSQLAAKATDMDIREQSALRIGRLLLYGFNRRDEAARSLRDFTMTYPHSIWRSMAEGWLKEAEGPPEDRG